MENAEVYSILVVDDNEKNLQVLGSLLIENSYEVSLVTSGEEAIEALGEALPDLILLDIMMPDMDGYQVCERLKSNEHTKDIPIIFLTAKTETEDIVKAFHVGGVDYITKPFKKEELFSRVSTHISLRKSQAALKEALLEKEELLESEHTLLDETLKGAIKLLIDILSLTSPSAITQSNNKRQIVRRLAKRLNFKQNWELEIASLLSQIGCVTLPSAILEKKNRGDALTYTESKLFQTHPKIGKKLISHIPRLEVVANAIEYQLNDFNPVKIVADEVQGLGIPLIARILRVVNDYEEHLINGKAGKVALETMRRSFGTYDPQILDALETEINNEVQGYIIRNLTLNQLMIGMILAEDLKNSSGIVLLTKGKEITEVSKERLFNYTKSGVISEPIKVLETISPDAVPE